MPDGRTKRSTKAKPFDRQAYYLSAKLSPESLRSLPRIARSAVKLAHERQSAALLLCAAAQIFSRCCSAVQVLLGKLALEAIFEADADRRLGRRRPPPAHRPRDGRGARRASPATFQTQAQRLLGEQVRRSTLDSTLAVTTAVDLETFESPEFFDDLQRVQTNALMQPLTLSQGLITTLGGILGAAGLTVALIFIEPLWCPSCSRPRSPCGCSRARPARSSSTSTSSRRPAQRLRFYLVQTLIGRDEAKEMRAFGLGQTLRRRWEQQLRRLRRRPSRPRPPPAAARARRDARDGRRDDRGVCAARSRSCCPTGSGLADAGAAVLAIRLLGTRIEQIFKGITGLFESSLFLERPPSLPRNARPQASRRDASGPPTTSLRSGEIVVEDVHFAYPNTDGEALGGVSLRIGAGEVVALVGENGSGKTTLAKLLGALFTPTDGRVMWDGVDIRTLDRTRASTPDRRHLPGLRALPADRSREHRLRQGRGRRRHGPRSSTAARQAGADDVPRAACPTGYETVLGKEFTGGYDLSLGQWQRIALARAFFRRGRAARARRADCIARRTLRDTSCSSTCRRWPTGARSC